MWMSCLSVYASCVFCVRTCLCVVIVQWEMVSEGENVDEVSG